MYNGKFTLIEKKAAELSWKIDGVSNSVICII